MSNPVPLSGVRVIDFTTVLAGPVATEQLAFLGAEVIKVESLKRPDLARGLAALSGVATSSPETSVSSTFNDLNLNKLGIQLNLTQAKAIDLMKRLVQVSDVVVDNMRPGVLRRLGLGYLALREANPSIIQVSSSACGSTGPEGQYVSYAATHCALSGLTYITGHADGPAVPLRAPSDMMRGTTDVFGVLVALVHRHRTGEGQFVDISSREALSSLIGHVFMDYTMNGRNQSRRGNDDDVMAPHNCYRCKGEDKWISIAIGTEEEWRAFVQAIGAPEWTRDERFNDQYRRWQHQRELDRLVAGWTVQHTHYEAMHILQHAGVAAMPAFNGEELFHDPHLKDRGALVEVEYAQLGKQVVLGPTWKLSATPAKISWPAPSLGEHNEYTFGQLLGLSPEEVAELSAEEVIY